MPGVAALMRWWRGWRQPRRHPQTGDLLTAGERVTWRIMGIYRRWSVFAALQLLTATWWTHPSWFPGGLAGWNYVWSDLAVVVEMMVGIAFFGQSVRDARVIRAELVELREDTRLLREDTWLLREDSRLLREIHARLTVPPQQPPGPRS